MKSVFLIMTVVNLTLIDLPGLTKVAVGEFSISWYLYLLGLLYFLHVSNFFIAYN